MADQTVNRNYRRQEEIIQPFKVDDGDRIFAGEIVQLNAGGFAVKGGDTIGNLFVGVAESEANNTSGAAGAIDVHVWRTGAFDFVFSGTATQADVGKKVYCVDTQTVALAATTTNDVLVGKITEFISATKVRVDIAPGIAA